MAALARQPWRPVSARSGRKEFIDEEVRNVQADSVLSADTDAP